MYKIWAKALTEKNLLKGKGGNASLKQMQAP